MSRISLSAVGFYVLLLISHIAGETDFQRFGGSFTNGGRFGGSAHAGSSFTGSSNRDTSLPSSASSSGDPFGLGASSTGTSGRSNSGFGSSNGGNSGNSVDSPDYDQWSGNNAATTRRRTTSGRFDSGSGLGSSGSSRRDSDIDRPSRTGVTAEPVEETVFGSGGSSGSNNVGGHDLRPSSSQDRPECTDCRIMTIRPSTTMATTTTAKSWLSRIFGRR